VVDAHQHWGIYNELGADTESESRACAQGGVTTALTYMRADQYYLNKGGDYGTFFPEVLVTSQGRAHVDYGFHLAPMMSRHIEEIPELVEKFGVPSFKVFMFYGSPGLHGRSDDPSASICRAMSTMPGTRPTATTLAAPSLENRRE
jgi:allantoinase